MSIEDDVSLLERVPTLRLLGRDALRVIAIGSEQQEFSRGSVLFHEDEQADCGYVVQSGSFRISVDDGSDHECDTHAALAGGGAEAGAWHAAKLTTRGSTHTNRDPIG